MPLGRLALIVVAVAVAVSSASRAAERGVPAHDGWVTDLAHLLRPEEEQALESLMSAYEQGSGHEIALLTVPDLGGQSLERYALEVGRDWGLGKEGRHDGALLLVARDERKMRIEVGRGLEGTLTDAVSGRIIRDVIAPELRRGRPYEALRAGIEAMHAAAGGDYGVISEASRNKRRGLVGLLPLLILLILFLSLGRHGGRRGGPGGLLTGLLLGSLMSHGRGGRRAGSWHGGSYGGSSGGGFGGFGGGGGFSGGGASGGW